ALFFLLCAPDENPYTEPGVIDPNRSDSLVVYDTMFLSETLFVRDTLNDTVRVIIRDTVIVEESDDDDDDDYRDRGKLTAEFYEGIFGFRVEDMLRSNSYPDNPSRVEELYSFEVRDVDNSSGIRFRGYLHPPRSGDYRFFLVSDDQSQVYLSRDDSPHGKRLIVEEKYFHSLDRWNGCPRSEEIHLEADEVYYIEVLYKQGLLGGHIQLGWRGPGVNERPVPGVRFSPFDYEEDDEDD
ncbi:MAG: PA14 domain-containing protein, partial [Chitinispirillaceae bacterium]